MCVCVCVCMCVCIYIYIYIYAHTHTQHTHTHTHTQVRNNATEPGDIQGTQLPSLGQCLVSLRALLCHVFA